MRKHVLCLAVGLGLVGLASTAQAIPVDVTYNLTINATFNGNPVGNNPGTGTLTLRFLNTGGGGTFSTISPGPVQLVSFVANQTINLTVGGVATVTGAATITGAGGGGIVLAGGTINLGPVVANLGGFIHCFPINVICNAALSLPASVPSPLSGTLPFGISGGLITPALPNVVAGGISWSGTFISLNSVPIPATITGVEVGRTAVIPEPSTGLLLGMGVLGLAGVAHRTRRRR